MKGPVSRVLRPALMASFLIACTGPAWAQTDANGLDTGDTAWMLAATALVLMMTIPGLALFYGGMVRKRNVLATLMQSFLDLLSSSRCSGWAPATAWPFRQAMH